MQLPSAFWACKLAKLARLPQTFEIHVVKHPRLALWTKHVEGDGRRGASV
jgi:hypothetical protein